MRLFIFFYIFTFFAFPHHASSAEQSRTCISQHIDAGILEFLQDDSEVVVSHGNDFVLLQRKTEGFFTVFDLKTASMREFHKKKGSPAILLGAGKIFIPGPRKSSVLDVHSGAISRADRATSEKHVGYIITDQDRMIGFRIEAHARSVMIARTDAGSFVLQITPKLAAYEFFKADMLKGKHCGLPISSMSRKQKARIANAARFFVWDQLTHGRLRTVTDILAHKDVMLHFMDPSDQEAIVDAYAFRATESAKASAEFSKVDSVKFMTFAAMPFYKAIKSSKYASFTDLSVFQRDEKITFHLLATEPFEGGFLNEYGFYIKHVDEVKTSDVQSRTERGWAWRQGDDLHEARVALLPPVKRDYSPAASFPKTVAGGLVFVDASLHGEDMSGTVENYIALYKSFGFRFSATKKVADLKSYLHKLVRDGSSLGYLVREGHADGDDENFTSLYPNAFVSRGEKRSAEGVETILIVFHKGEPSRNVDYISYKEFNGWLQQRKLKTQTPLVYLNTSCWGHDKSWFSLGMTPPEYVMEIASLTPANFLVSIDVSATQILLKAIRSGGSFDQVRKALNGILEHREKLGDNYILPDDQLYPHALNVVRVERSLSVTRNGKTLTYKPAGYI